MEEGPDWVDERAASFSPFLSSSVIRISQSALRLFMLEQDKPTSVDEVVPDYPTRTP